MKEKFTDSAKITITGREHYDDSEESKFVHFKRWEKNGKRRIYLNDYKRRTFGFIDCETGKYTQYDSNGLTREQITAAIDTFRENYEI